MSTLSFFYDDKAAKKTLLVSRISYISAKKGKESYLLFYLKDFVRRDNPPKDWFHHIPAISTLSLIFGM